MIIEAEYVAQPLQQPIQACIVLDQEELKMLRLLAGSVIGNNKEYMDFYSKLYYQLGNIGVKEDMNIQIKPAKMGLQ
jgi:hypothetical protein